VGKNYKNNSGKEVRGQGKAPFECGIRNADFGIKGKWEIWILVTGFCPEESLAGGPA
jgi:hypothetical protein